MVILHIKMVFMSSRGWSKVPRALIIDTCNPDVRRRIKLEIDIGVCDLVHGREFSNVGVARVRVVGSIVCRQDMC